MPPSSLIDRIIFKNIGKFLVYLDDTEFEFSNNFFNRNRFLMFDKRRKIQEVRESFLDTDELLQSIGQKQRGRQVATGASTQDSITNAFE